MPAPYKVQVHQSSRAASVGSSYSRSSNSYASSAADSSCRSLSPGTYRQYGGEKHEIQVKTSSNGTRVINHNRPGHESGSPSPGYGNPQRRS